MSNKNFAVDFHVDVLGMDDNGFAFDIGFHHPLHEYHEIEGHVSIIVPMQYPEYGHIYHIRVHAVPEAFMFLSVANIALTAIRMAKEWIDEVNSGTMN